MDKEPGGLQSIASQRVKHDWSNLAHTHSENSNGIRNLVTNASDSAKAYVSDWSRSTIEHQSTAYWPQVCCRIHYNSLLWTVRNGRFPATSVNKGCHKSSVIATTANGEVVSHEETQEGKNTCQERILAAVRLQPLPMVNPEETQIWRHRILAPDRWGAYGRKDFREPRLSHLLIHRKALNFVTWDIWFSSN